MFIYRILFIIGIGFAYDWDYSILPTPVWNVTNCETINKSCFSEETSDTQYQCSSDICTLRVIVILPKAYHLVSIEKVKSVFEELKSEPDWPFNLEVVSFYDDKCQQEFATKGLIEADKKSAHVIIGPSCDYCLASVSRVAKYIGNSGMPVITPAGFTFAFSQPKTNCDHEYYMTINTGPTDFRSMSEFFHLIMRRYQWKKLNLLYDKNQQTEVGGTNLCQFMFETLIEEVKTVPGLSYNDGDLILLGKNYSDYFERVIGVDYGIILLCTGAEGVRNFAIAGSKWFQSGEYTAFNFQFYNNHTNASRPWYDPKDTPERNNIARQAFRSIYTFTVAEEADFQGIEERRNKSSIYLDAIYDGMYLLREAVKKSSNGTIPRGYQLINNMLGAQVKGKNGKNFTINCNGRRVSNYVLLQLDSSGEYQVAADYDNQDKIIKSWEVQWVNGDPLDTPVCGYDKSLCPPFDTVKVLLITLILVLCLGILIVGIILYRHFKLKKEIYSMAWKVNYDDIVLLPIKPRSSFQSTSSLRRGSQLTYLEADGISVAGDRQLYTNVGFYKAIRVALKNLQDIKIELNRDQLIDLKVMKDLSHDNLVKFYGACLDIPNCILSEYCPKGSLQDILENDNVKLDTTFKMSLIMDIVRGMSYLHHSVIKSHGALKSTNCLIDSRFVLKITDFGLYFLRKHSTDIDYNEESHSYWERQLWTAPEILRMENPPPGGTQKGDIYSFAIIMHEIIERQGVFHLNEFKTAREKVDAVRKGPDANGGQPLRPSLGEALCEEEVALMMKKCWSEDAADRPDFSSLKSRLKHINKEADGNLLDNLLARMEQYANNLESLVEERTSDYLEEKRRCEELLYQLLPKSVAQQLITGESVIAETFEYVTIHFSDIVGFTALSADSTPLQVVEFLNDLYTCFDSIIENFDVYKVETIGDSYMVVSGLPVRNGKNHAREIARMSLALLKAVKTFKIRHRQEERLKLRIGIHTGPCVAGVVGLKMPRYCLFGDTVNTASRMETNGLPLKIHISPVTKEFLDIFGTFDVERRGEVELKGKGKMMTYWLNGECEKKNTVQSPKHEVKSPKIPCTPISNNIRKQMANNGKALNEMNFQEHQIDETEVPLLSITSPPEYNSNA